MLSNDLVTKQPGAERGSPYWVFTATLMGMEKVVAMRTSAMTTQDHGMAEAVKTLWTTFVNQQPQEMLA